MTSLLSRSPLQQHMPSTSRGGIMAGTNNGGATGATTTAGRRRTARHFDEGEQQQQQQQQQRHHQGEEEEEEVQQQQQQQQGPARKRVKKVAYEEKDDEFMFSRGRSKRGKTETTGSQQQQQQQKPEGKVMVGVPKAGEPVKKKPPRKTLPVTPDKAERTVRRSKRLSGENEADPFVDAGRSRHSALPPSQRVEQVARADAHRDGSPALQPNGAALDALHVLKKRTPKRIELVESETPVIRRNKAMRQTSGDGSRRSSAGLRGKRASSLIDAGSSSALPHTEVATVDFYKHISQDLVEPRRMKQLLVWCGSRALGEKRKEGEGAEEGQARHAARTIQEELIAAFSSRNDLSNWFDRPDEAAESVSLIKKPNPRNEQNQAKLTELEAELTRLRAEKASWDSLMSSIPKTVEKTASPSPEPLDASTIDASLLSPSQAEILETLLQPLSAPDQPPTTSSDPKSAATARTSKEEEVQARLSASAKDLHFKIDSYHDSLHRLEQFVETAGRVADRVLEKTAERLEQRDKERRERGEKEHGGARVGEMDALRALGRALNKKTADGR